MDDFLKLYKINKNETNKIITHTSMRGGKWCIPKDKLSEFYKLTKSDIIGNSNNKLLVEKMHEYFPFVIDIDLKYKTLINERQYNEDTIESLIEFLWCQISECIKITDISGKGIAFFMEKEKPYPCDKQKYKSKDGIHIAFPEIIVNKQAFKKIITKIQNENKIKQIFEETCEIKPDNSDKEILDSSFSSWQLYGCGKDGETPYKLTKVFKIESDGYPEEIDEDIFEEYYTDPLNILKSMSMCYRDNENVEYKESFLKTLKQKTKKKSSSNTMVNNDDDDIYNIKVNNDKPEEIQIELIKSLVTCLSKERSDDFGGWRDVGLCLHNLDESLFDDWEKFSMLSDKYEESVCDKFWNSFRSDHSGDTLKIGSLVFWAKNDNMNKYIEIMRNTLAGKLNDTIFSKYAGPDAHDKINKVIYEFYKDQFISVNIGDDWYYFNGTRWIRTLKGTKLKKCIHNEIWDLYGWHARKLRDENNELGADICLDFQKKLLKESYVKTLMDGLAHMFYIDDIMEKFDTNTSLLGFENGVYDLDNNVFREGRPGDYITMSTKVSMPVKAEQMPIKLDDMINSFSSPDLNEFPEMRHYNRFFDDMNDFIDKIVPIPAVKGYTLRFLAKCLSGENRDEGFYIWTGTGGNGKSKLIDLMSMCMGDYACNLPIALLTQKRKASGAASPEMAITRGKRLAVMQEPDVNETLNVGQMKEITGNDKITARGLYKEPFEFTPQFKLICMCNDLPHIPSNDDGTWRRLEVVDFIARFVDDEKDVNELLHRYQKDKGIKNKIPMWVIPFYAMLLPHWREYDENGIEIPDEVKAKTNEYRNNNDLVGQWIDQNCEEAENEISSDGITETAPTDFDTLYEDFKEWCGEEELKNIPDKGSVRNALKKWQEKSRFGLSYGKKKSDSGANGYEKAMRFNLNINQ